MKIKEGVDASRGLNDGEEEPRPVVNELGKGERWIQEDGPLHSSEVSRSMEAGRKAGASPME